MNLVISISILAACFFGYTLLGERKRPQRGKRIKSDVMEVTTMPLMVHQGPVSIETNGVVVPLREIKLATEVAGRIVEQSDNLRAGRMVDPGEILIRLDDTEFQLETKRLRAQSAQGAAEIESIDVGIGNTQQLRAIAEQQLKIAQQQLSRAEKLYSGSAFSVSEVDVLKRAQLEAQMSVVEHDNRRRELVAQRKLVIEKGALNEIMLQRAALDLERCVVRAPIGGRVVESTVEEQSFVPAGAPFVTIEDTSSAEVQSNLTADQMVWIWNSSTPTPKPTTRTTTDQNETPAVGATISHTFGDQTETWPARLARIDGVGIDLNTRTYPCLFRVGADGEMFSNLEPERFGPRKRLTRGMFVSVAIKATPQKTLYRVPEIAIRPGNQVWLNIEGHLRIVRAKTLSRTGDDWVVDLTVPGGESNSLQVATVVLSPISYPVQGMEIEPVDAEMPGGNPRSDHQRTTHPPTTETDTENVQSSNIKNSLTQGQELGQ